MLEIVIVAVADVRAAVAFYRAAFGWAQLVDAPVYAELAMPGARLGLYAREAYARTVGIEPRVSHVELYVRCDDLALSCARVAAAGGRLLSARAMRDWGDEVAYYADLDGNVLALAAVR